jgi:hypothetical protein
MSENSSDYSKRPKLQGNQTEMFRLYYDKNIISANDFIILEELSMARASNLGWKIFKVLPSDIFPVDLLIICKN